MASEFVELKLRDMYAIKHALQNVLGQKKNRLDAICANHDLEIEINGLNKDIAHEETLIEKFDREIADFKDKYQLIDRNSKAKVLLREAAVFCPDEQKNEITEFLRRE